MGHSNSRQKSLQRDLQRVSRARAGPGQAAGSLAGPRESTPPQTLWRAEKCRLPSQRMGGASGCQARTLPHRYLVKSFFKHQQRP